MRFGVKSSRKTTVLMIIAASLLVIALLLPGCGGDEAAPVEDKTSEEVYPKIQEIIYPILGYPSIVPAGEEFTMELDFTLNDPAAAQPGSVEEWRVSIATSNAYISCTGTAFCDQNLDNSRNVLVAFWNIEQCK